jgi:hypothetical protein
MANIIITTPAYVPRPIEFFKHTTLKQTVNWLGRGVANNVLSCQFKIPAYFAPFSNTKCAQSQKTAAEAEEALATIEGACPDI